MKKLPYFVLGAALTIGMAAQAQMKIEISGVGSNQIPVAVAAFADEGMAPAQVSSIIKADLERSGVFKVIDAGAAIAEGSRIDYGQWKSRGADALVIGSVKAGPGGSFSVSYKLIDTIKATEAAKLELEPAPPQYTRLAAHKVADDIYEKLTGTRGVFSTRIAYVSKYGERDYRLEVADADGEGMVDAVRSQEPIISPSWSPDGSRVAYVSFESRKPVIFVHDLPSRKRVVIANEKGSNSAPSWSPDGTRLVVGLSRDGHYQVYGVNADGSGLRRLSNGNGIDSEPRYSSDGASIYFTSDRSGGPQIYKMDANGGNATRVTFSGGYNISARPSPDGKTLAYVSQRDGMFVLYAMDLASGQEMRLADNATEPSFSPNGKYIMYATDAGRRKALAVVSVDGRIKQRLSTQAGTIREPTWGPFMK
ncbi:MAG: Tol-Pal system beta propeller repeat protein TolB [Pseudomonadota bacterium]